MQENEVHLVLTDQRMPQITGVELLTKMRVKYPRAIRMLFTGYIRGQYRFEKVTGSN